MTRRPIKDMAASVHQRLLNAAKARGLVFNELLQYYAMERFLYRLGRSPHNRKFVLKGALAMGVWGTAMSRRTMDIDLLARMNNSVEELAALARQVCSDPVEPDGLTFGAETVTGERIAETAMYGGVRVKLEARLGSARIPIQVDVGFGDAVVPPPRPAEYPTILPGLPAPRLRVYSRESAIAEKFEAMVKLGELNSRMKDFFDIWLLSGQYPFAGSALQKALFATFKRRATAMPARPEAFDPAFAQSPAKQAQWAAFVRRSRLSSAPAEFSQVVEAAAAFLSPVSEALALGEELDAVWPPGGPWERQSLPRKG